MARRRATEGDAVPLGVVLDPQDDDETEGLDDDDPGDAGDDLDPSAADVPGEAHPRPGRVSRAARLLAPSSARTRPAKPKPKRPTGRRSSQDAELDRIGAELGDAIVNVAMPLAFLLPTTGVVVADRSDAIAGAFVRLGKDNPTVLRFLQSSSKVAPYSDLGAATAAILTAVAVDRGAVAPDCMPAFYLRVTDAYVQTHPEDVEVAARVAAAAGPAPGQARLHVVPPPPAVHIVP